MSRESAASATGLAEAPDYVAPLHAYRLWAVEEVAGSARLRSLYWPCIWPVGAPFAAQCHSRSLRLWRKAPHETPVTKCTCGIYAVPAAVIPRLARDGAMPPDRSFVIGAVSLWGSVVECERGWRAAFAYPDSLFVPWRCSSAEKTAVDLEAYGVPVELLEVWNVNAALDVVVELAA